jgi:hypothetical protein
MSFRLRLIALSTATLIAGAYGASLAFEPLCSVFHSVRHHLNRSVQRSVFAPANENATLSALSTRH